MHLRGKAHLGGHDERLFAERARPEPPHDLLPVPLLRLALEGRGNQGVLLEKLLAHDVDPATVCKTGAASASKEALRRSLLSHASRYVQ